MDIKTIIQKKRTRGVLSEEEFRYFISDNIFEKGIMQDTIKNFFMQFHKTKIQMPDKFLPNKTLLDIHFQKFLNT